MDQSQDIEKEKDCLRQEILKKRDALSEMEQRARSERIVERLLDSVWYQQAKKLLCYVAFKSEVRTEWLLRQALSDGKQVYCPKVQGRDMDFYRIEDVKELAAGYRGILEPAASIERSFLPEAENSQVLMIIPGAVFDAHYHRIGYGGGYYDRYLARCEKQLVTGCLYKAALAYELQLVERLPVQAHDQQVDRIVTEQRVMIMDHKG